MEQLSQDLKIRKQIPQKCWLQNQKMFSFCEVSKLLIQEYYDLVSYPAAERKGNIILTKT